MVITYSSALVVIRHSLSFDHCDVFRLPCLGATLFHSALMHFVFGMRWLYKSRATV